MDQFKHKTLVTKPYELTYSYYTSPGFEAKVDSGVPTLMISHGFPDDAHMWAGTLPTLLKLPYPIILIDILGLGDSSKSTTVEHYSYKQQANSLAQILDEENVGKVIAIGHDWGSAITQRFYLYHRARCIGVSLLCLAYQIPSTEPFNLDQANIATTKRFGYPQWEYWNYFTAPDAPAQIEANLERFWEANNGYYPSPDPTDNGQDIWMREMFDVKDGMRDYIQGTGKWAGFTVELNAYARDAQLKKRYLDRLKEGRLAAPVNYYHSLKNNTMLEDERVLAQNPKIEVPLLYIGMTGDWVCRTDLMVDAKEKGLVPDLEEQTVVGNHWSMYDAGNAAIVAGYWADWLSRKFPV
ncbi:alpha/beta-hydrolase [Pseudovirgaria hyperparasitica]|uniref:Alpha/beta-hydrolase n=1 Tax=Pseudovirgaria hyperparasitica TaxID=470096 RepID=A0A6A6W786_9PEZI|nr:alpha/beta-hydrolase [Pseudovirgaria hyperparasitica]KAF2756941.1 alpha/beta-hydrolase [Pseudovirgaria hyperparasitica]